MKIEVLVKPGAREESVERLPDGKFKVLVTASPQDGEANDAVLRVLAQHLGIAKTKLRIQIGSKSRRKLIEVL